MNKYSLKEIQQIQMKPQDYDDVIIYKKYSILKNKIYYFYQEHPYPEGVLEAENLLEEEDLENDNKSVHIKGPFKFRGSNRFYRVYKKNMF